MFDKEPIAYFQPESYLHDFLFGDAYIQNNDQLGEKNWLVNHDPFCVTGRANKFRSCLD